MQDKFKIQVTFRYGWRPSRYPVIVIPAGKDQELYIVCGRNKQVIFSSNRPLYISKGLRHRKPDFQVVFGKFNENVYFDVLVNAIWTHFQEEQKRK